MSTAHWEIKKLDLHRDVVWSLAMSSLKVRLFPATLTGLTVGTASAFMMFLLGTPRGSDPADVQAWWLMLTLALVVATVGVLNAMLMSVTQRYREIGTIKCLGALDRLILYSVMLESMIVGGAGAIAGAAVGLVLAIGVGLTADDGVRWGMLPVWLGFVIGLSTVLTMFGAAVPAWIASKMPPIEAMRGEK